VTLNVQIKGENNPSTLPRVQSGWEGYLKKGRKTKNKYFYYSAYQKPNVNKWLKHLKKCFSSQLCCDSDWSVVDGDIGKVKCESSVRRRGAWNDPGVRMEQIRFFVISFWGVEGFSMIGLAIVLSTAMLINLTIKLTLVKQNVERNPGPLSIVTYNCNGLGNQTKLKRLIRKVQPMVERGAIIMLQETHLINIDYLKLMYKHKIISNCVRTNSAGTIILFNNDYEVEYQKKEDEGRTIIAVLREGESGLVVMNSYFPNDHKEAINFAEKSYTKLLETRSEHPNCSIIWAGDLNVCLTQDDCLNRQRLKAEQLLADVIVDNNKMMKLVDAYRSRKDKDGYTWKRGNCYSRLDYVFISNELETQIKNVSIDWNFDISDHAAVCIEFEDEEEVKTGPGITKVNTKILEDPKIAIEVGKEIEEMMKQASENWNPHMKLEFLKVAIRSTIANKTAEIRKVRKNEINDVEEEISSLEDMKIRWIKEISTSTENIDKAISKLKGKLLSLKNKLESKLNFITKAKWFEYGEKSNKFFLNLNKSRQKKKLIKKIRNGDAEYRGQKQVTDGITEFYKKLYSKNEDKDINNQTNNSEDDFYQECPKLSEKNREYMEKDISLDELKEALKTCKESAPGSDGIPYEIYKKYWNLTGKYILEAWKHSLETGKLPTSHAESVITLLPKENKDPIDIKNWRPITLSNCDAKIVTKVLAIRMSKILETIIDKSQTAYIPGRSVSDNLRANFFYKNHCQRNNIESVLISLDAKKAFDSVDHEYIGRTLKEYGFGKKFILTFRTLYRDLTSRVMINGFKGEAFNIERGVKQGDALSCAIFIICIDPLLRNLNKSSKIEEISIRRNNKVKKMGYKAAAYADDISVICKNNPESIQQVFTEYERLTRRSGLELNADKTEILMLNKKQGESVTFRYLRSTIKIKTVEKMKICGLIYATDLNEEYEFNVNEKIKKLTTKIRIWSSRNLTMEGKALIVKTFGLSQLIYNMQVYGFEKSELINVERIIFKFLWSTKDNENGIDRIKRAIMKNSYEEGGMKITDVESLNSALKLKQFIRASKSSHSINKIQMMLSEENQLQPEYATITNEESVTKIAQETINIITDANRKNYETLSSEEYESDKNLIDEVTSINLETYLKRKNRPFQRCIARNLQKEGIVNLGQAIQTLEYEQDNNLVKQINLTLSTLPNKLILIAKCAQNDMNNEQSNEMKYIQLERNVRKDVHTITTKELQQSLKTITKKIESLNVAEKLNLAQFNKENIIRTRENCKNAKLRNIYFRLIHNDFFTREKMKKYKMVESEICPRCSETETTKHMLWECGQVQVIWKLFNKAMTITGNGKEKVESYDDIFKACMKANVNVIKLQVLKQLIQIERPRNWSEENMKILIKDTIEIEKFNCNSSRLELYYSKWQPIINSLKIYN